MTRPSLLRFTAAAKNASASPLIEFAGYSLMSSKVVWAVGGSHVPVGNVGGGPFTHGLNILSAQGLAPPVSFVLWERG